MDESLRIGLRGNAENGARYGMWGVPTAADIRVMVAAIETDPVCGGGTVVSAVVIESNNISGVCDRNRISPCMVSPGEK